MLGFKRIGAMLLGLSSLLSVAAVPLDSFNLTDTARSFLDERAVKAIPGPPHFVIYSDKFVSGQTGPPPVAQVKVRFCASIGQEQLLTWYIPGFQRLVCRL